MSGKYIDVIVSFILNIIMKIKVKILIIKIKSERDSALLSDIYWYLTLKSQLTMLPTPQLLFDDNNPCLAELL